MKEKAHTFQCAANLCGGRVSFGSKWLYACEQMYEYAHTYIDDTFSEIQERKQIVSFLMQDRGHWTVGQCPTLLQLLKHNWLQPLALTPDSITKNSNIKSHNSTYICEYL